MSFRISLVLRWILLAAISVPLAAGSYEIATKSSRREANYLATEISKLPIHKLYVPNFPDASGEILPQGVFFAAVFSEQIAKQAHDFEVLNRVEARKFLQAGNGAEPELSRPEPLSRLASQYSLDAVLRGRITILEEFYRMEFSVEDLHGRKLLQAAYEEPRDPTTEAYFPVELSHGPAGVFFAGLDGVSAPKCVQCPNPSYSDAARRDKISGTILASAVVTPEGRLEQIRLVRKLESGLDKATLQTLSTWRLVPAHDSDGKTIAVRVPLEVSFRVR